VDEIAKKGEFMWMKIHVHPPTSTYMQVHPHKMFFGRPIGHRIAQTIARLAQPSNFQLIPTYSNIFQRIFFRSMNHRAQRAHRLVGDPKNFSAKRTQTFVVNEPLRRMPPTKTKPTASGEAMG
jgi:hypothetical protein